MRKVKKNYWSKIKNFGLSFLFAFLLLGSIVTYIKDRKEADVSIEKSIEPIQTESAAQIAPEEESESDLIEPEVSVSNSKINLNTATSEELQTVKGIGPSKASAIIQYRTDYGNFVSVDELLEVSGIGEKTLANIRDYFTVE